MEDLYDIDNCMDDREFRNYVYAILPRLGFENVGIEDVRISDEDKINDNDLFASKNGFSYTVQTYLNKEINQKIINECFKDMEKNMLLLV